MDKLVFSMEKSPTIHLFAPAKINWVLTVERRRQDGYHDIHTIFQALAWGDELACRALPERICAIACDDPTIPTGHENLVAKAWRRLADAYPKVGGMHVHLTKHIPAGAGLGGGSSDAAATLVAVDQLFKLGLSPDALETHAAAVGSDCAFFIRGGAALGHGRGERLRRIESRLPAINLVVVYPGFASPTAEAYRRIQPEHWEGGGATERALIAMEKGDLAAFRGECRNIFHDLALAADERYQILAESMEREGLTQPLLSGSGSAMFAFAERATQAREACRRLMEQYPLAVRARPQGMGVKAVVTAANHTFCPAE